MEILTEEQRAAKPCLIAICATCSGIVAACVQDAERAKDTAKEVASWVRDGLAVHTRTVAEVRAGEWCKCKRSPKTANAKRGSK